MKAREKLGEWLAQQVAPVAPEGLAKNAVCVGFGNVSTQSRYDSDYLLAGVFQRIMMECKLDSYYDEPNIAYLTPIALLETAT